MNSANHCPKLSLSPEALIPDTADPNEEEAPRVAPNRATSSEISRLVRVCVPSSSICAVTTANPGKPDGSNSGPAPVILKSTDTAGRRWSSMISTVRPFFRVASTGRGSWTRRISFDTGAKPLRSTLLTDTAFES